MKIIDAKDAYIANCKASNKSETTLEGYSRSIRMMADWMESKGISLIENVQVTDLVAWKADIAEKVSSSSLNLYCTHIKGFFSFCEDMEIVENNPYKARLMAVKVKEADKKEEYEHLLSEEQFCKVLTNNSPADMYRKFIARNRALVAILATSGMRNTSLRNVKMSDLDWNNGTITVDVAKGGKTGKVLFSTIAQEAVKEYLASGIRPDGTDDDQPLFGIVKDGKWEMFSRTNLSEVIERAVASFAGKSDVRSHALRHTAASILGNNGMRDGEISLFLMHSSDGSGASVTARYINRDLGPLFAKANEIFSRVIK